MIDELNEKIDFSSYPSIFEPNYKLKTFTDIHDFVDSVYSIDFHKKEHTVKMSDFFINHVIEYIKLIQFDALFHDPLRIKIAVHHMFTFIINIVAYKTGKGITVDENEVTMSIPKTLNYYAFSAGDNSIIGFLIGLRQKHITHPTYASSFTIELHKDEETNNHYLIFKADDNYLNINGQ